MFISFVQKEEELYLVFHILTNNILFEKQIQAAMIHIKDNPVTNIIITDKPLETLDIFESNYYFILNKEKSFPTQKHKENVIYFSTIKEFKKIFPIINKKIIENDNNYQTIQKLEKENDYLKKRAEDIEGFTSGAKKLQKKIYYSQKSSFFDIFIHYQYFQCISGDLFFIRSLKDKTYIVIGDVVHHGTRAGLYGTSIYTLLCAYFNTIQENMISLYSILSYLFINSTDFGYTTEDTLHTIIMEINHKNNKLKQIAFGQAEEPALLIDKNTKEIMELSFQNHYPPINDYMLKKMEMTPDKFAIEEYQLPEDYGILLYSDGLRGLFKTLDEENTKNEYSIKRMKDLILTSLQRNDLTNIIPSFIEDCNNFSLTSDVNDSDKNNEKYIINAIDDITIVLLSLKARSIY